MKKILFTIFLTAMFTVLATAQQAKKYALKSGYLKLELSGSTVGTREIWWDNYGQKTAEREKSITTTKMLGMKNTEQKDALTIIVDNQFWTINYLDNSGLKGIVPNFADDMGMNSMSEKEQEAFANQLLEDMGGKRLGTETLGGYICDVVSLMGTKVWVYKGAALKTEGNLMGIETKEMFTAFKPGTAVDASKFKAPANIKYKDVSEEQKASGFGSLMEALGGMDDEDLEDDEETIPVKYPFEKFKKAVENFTYPGFSCVGVNTMEGIHAATYIKGLGSSIMIVATSRKNSDQNVEQGFEKFTHNGRTCYYGKIDDEETEGTALVQEYPAYDMHIVITAMPDMDKKTMLSIAGKLKFD
jgi:hypothetical protein